MIVKWVGVSWQGMDLHNIGALFVLLGMNEGYLTWKGTCEGIGDIKLGINKKMSHRCLIDDVLLMMAFPHRCVME